MRERVALTGGTLRIDSAPGAGTTLEASLPVRRRTTETPARLHVAKLTSRLGRDAVHPGQRSVCA